MLPALKMNRTKLQIGLNLRILPLKVLENSSTQKCLLPKTSLPSQFKPGSWVRCEIDDGTQAICQVFSRGMPTLHCFLDDCVSIGTVGVHRPTDYSPLKVRLGKERKLKGMELLDTSNNAVPILKANVIVTISKQILMNLKYKISIKYLTNALQLMLESLYLTDDCMVRTKDIQEVGITTVQFKSVTRKVGDRERSLFYITADTQLQILNVRLEPDENLLQEKFYPFGFERAQQDLDDLLQVAELQKQRRMGCGLRLPLNALILGPPGSGKSALISAFVREHQCNLFYITVMQLRGQYPGQTEEQLRNIFQAAIVFVQKLKPKEPTVILLKNLHLFCPAVKFTVDNGNALRISAQLFSLIDALRMCKHEIICLATTSSPEALSEIARRPGRFDQEICISTPNEKDRQRLLAIFFDRSLLLRKQSDSLKSSLLKILAQGTQGYIVADLILLVRSIEQSLMRPRKTQTNFDILVQNCLAKSQPSSIRGGDVTVMKIQSGFSSIGGMQELKRTLEVSVLAALKQRAAYQRLGLSMPKGILLYGPPGCAKTTIAKCLAAEANCSLIATSSAEVYSPYVGCAEKFIMKIFDTARKHAPCIIFLDEIDTLLGRRALNSRSISDVQARILSTLLTEMDGIVPSTSAQCVLVVAATNRPDMVDDALLRPGRFDKVIHVPAPDNISRLSLLKLHAKRMPFASNVDLVSIAKRTANYSGADICNLCNEAALHALQLDFNVTEIHGEDFDHVLKQQKPSLTKRQISWYSGFQRKFINA